MAADGMDSRGRANRAKDSDDLFDLGKESEAPDRKDRPEEDIDPPTESGAASQEIVDLPNIHYGSRSDRGGAGTGEDGQAPIGRDPLHRDATSRDSGAFEGRRSGSGVNNAGAPSETEGPADTLGNPPPPDADGLNRSTTNINPIGPIAETEDAGTPAADGDRIVLAAAVQPATPADGSVVDVGSTAPPPPPPSGGPPVLAAASFYLAENAGNGDTVGTLVATDPDTGDILSFAITGGNGDGAFAIDPATGAITVANAGLLDHESTPSRTLTVTVADGTGFTDSAAITIGVTDANEAPVAADQSFSVSEGAGNGDAVGTVAASDPDAGDTLSYAITGGNADGAFAIDPATGTVTVADASLLDHETTPSRTVTVTVTDAAGLTDTADITIGVTDANEAPVAADQSFSVSEGASNGDAVGTVAASDPDAGDTLSYAITGGNADGAFAIDPATGAVTVADASLLDHETTPSRTVTVTVTDAAGLTDTADIPIGVTDANEAPGAADQSFSVSEGASNGDAVGTVAASDPDAGDTLSY
ncbi:MAG: cadherin repeat domain-containing protein, partial [Inquilinus sp.]|nr:cadherin repeat domain-containing protein [Inquilinus sp.]